MRPQVFKFAAVGATSTIIDFALLSLFVGAGLGLYLSLFFSYTIGAVNGYLLNNKWTFAHLNKPSTFGGFLKYASISFVGLALTESVVYVLHNQLHLGITIDKLMAVVVVFGWNYFANKHFTFKDPLPL